MDRNTIIGILLIGAIIITFQIMNKPDPEELERYHRAQDSLAQVRAEREQEMATQRKITAEEIHGQGASDSTALQNKMAELGLFGKHLLGSDEYYVLENELVKLTISKKGGRPYEVQLLNYQTHDSMPLILFSGDSTIFNLQFPTTQNRVVNTQDLYFDLAEGSPHMTAIKRDARLVMRIDLETNRYMEYIYTLEPGSYMVGFDINMKGMEQVISQNLNTLNLEWEIYAPQQEKGKENELNYSTIFYKHHQDDVENFAMRSKKDELSETIKTSLKWVAFKDQFFSSVIIADQNFTDGKLTTEKLPEESRFLQVYNAELGLPFDGGNSTIDMQFYFGPNHYKTLKQYGDLELDKLVSVGKSIIGFINRFIIIELFHFLEKFFTNYGLIILILTLVIKMLLLPLTYRSYLSQAKMRVLKPQIDTINEKIPKDKPMERQKATMELYKKVGINPMGGCLPMLLQMPILFAMFKFFPSSIELRQESFLWATDLSTYDSIIEWSTYIPLLSNIYGNHVSLFTILMTVSTLLTIKMSSQATGANTQMPGMQTMMYIMPIMFMFVLNKFSAGLTYYYFLANMITFGQNILFKRFIDEDALLKKLQAKKTKPQKKSGFQSRLEKMAKERGYNVPKK
jgi:YidC/Oxa1 family membrane protein insertase